MDTKVSYAIVGLFVVILTAGIVISSAWIASGSHRKTYAPYVTYMNEAVIGLTDKAPVKFNGVDVGYVERIALNPGNPQQVRLQLQIEAGTPINSSTIAMLKSSGLTGFTFVDLEAEQTSAPPIELLPSEPYPIIRSKPSFLFQLDTMLSNMSASINELSNNINSFFSAQNRDSVDKILVNLAKISEMIEKNSTHIDQSIHSASELLQRSSEAADDIRHLTQQADATFKHGSQALRGIEQETLPEAYAVLEKLKQVLGNIETLSNSLYDNPSMMVRGKVPEQKGPGE